MATMRRASSFNTSFKVALPWKYEVQSFEELITKKGGTLEENPKIIILPSICKASDLKGTAQFYTKYWLMECLKFNSFEIEAAGHHNPRAAFDGMENLLEGTVVAISHSYPVSERGYIIELITALGGRYQEVFTRRDSETGERITHLICSDLDDDKPKAAERGDVRVVLAEWVYDSFDEKKYMEEHRYDPSHLSTAAKEKRWFPLQLRANPVFMIGHVYGQYLTNVSKMLAELGGHVSKQKYYDEEAVGILTGTLSRTEKILGCIATGKFVLKPDYIVESHKKGKFLPVDEQYLWHEGGDGITLNDVRELARASFNWLKARMEDETKKPMYGVRVCVVDQLPEKKMSFRRLVEASGGIWVESVDEADLILKDDKSTVELPGGKKVENLLYINKMILSGPA